MRIQRFAAAVLALTVLGLLAALPAGAKEGVTATLTTKVPLDAPEGKQIRIAWTLGYADGQGKRRPFGAGYLFVRLKSASGGEAVTEYAGGDRGEYWATIAVPKGGIGDIEFGLVGWATDKNGTRRADKIFPITNDPLPGSTPSSPPAAGDSGGPPEWIWFGGAALLLAALGAALVRRQRLARA